MIRSAAQFGLLVSIALPALLCAKGDTVLIEIQGGSLRAPIRATDPAIEQFNVWDGMMGVNGAVLENATGFIIDWHAGIVTKPPARLPQYQVSFYAGCRGGSNEPGCAGEKPHLAYVVSYDWDPSSGQGFVYLPGSGDPRWQRNVTSIYRSVEGHWFRASDAWDHFVKPLIAKSENPRPSR